VTLIQEDVQLQMSNNSNMFQQRIELDNEIDELQKLMMKFYKWRYNERKKTVSHKVQLNERDYIKKICGQQQHKVWDPGRMKLKPHG
jgi:hypothetical protein